MNLDRSLIFSYLEEDNIQRAYFRVRPLLSLDGDVQQEALSLWPNEGGLRIVPDRNEQHTFKVRMRKLGSYCVIDLRNLPADAGKIRTNKNYKPERGEVNQYILYSDTVHEVPEHTYYQLLDGRKDDYVSLAKESITPLFYIREGDTLYGPVHKSGTEQPQPAQEAAAVMFDVKCPDGVMRSILCMEDEAPAGKEVAPAESSVSEEPAVVCAPPLQEKETPSEDAAALPHELPIGTNLQILDQTKDHEETLRQLDKPVSEGANLLRQNNEGLPLTPPAAVHNAPLSGTPLVRTPLHVAAKPSKNHTQEIISNQWSVGKYEAPAQNLPVGTAMRAVDNPVQSACHALRNAWNTESAHEQLLDYILSLDGLLPQLESKLCGGQNVTVMQHILRSRLEDLEAERLTALCELDRAHRDVDAYKQELLASIAARLTRETNQLESNKENAQAQLDALKNEVNALTLQRDGLVAKVNELQSHTLPEAFSRIAAEAQMTAPINGIPLRMSPISGQHIAGDQLIERLMGICAESACPIDRNTAIALLVLMAISPRIGVVSATTAALSTLIQNIAYAFGWQNGYAHQYSAEQRPIIGARPVDSTPSVLATSLPNFAPINGATKLTLSHDVRNLTQNAAYDVCQWPILMLPALPFVPSAVMQDVLSVSQESINAFISKKAVSDAELDAVLQPVLSMATPLNGSAHKALYRFVSICAGLMDGGLPVAADWGLLLWVIPNVKHDDHRCQAMKSQLDEFPLSLSKL